MFTVLCKDYYEIEWGEIINCHLFITAYILAKIKAYKNDIVEIRGGKYHWVIK